MANSDQPVRLPGGAGPYPEDTGRPGSTLGDSAVSPDRAAPVAGGIVFLLSSALAGVVLALPAAWLWARVAHPAAALLTTQGLSYGEVQLNQQSEVTLWFLVVGFGFGLVAGLVVGWRGHRWGVMTVVAVVTLCAVASGLTAFLGISVFGPDARAQAAGANVGDLITSNLSLGTPLVYLGWPIGGLAGTCLAILTWPVFSTGPADTSEPSRSGPGRSDDSP